MIIPLRLDVGDFNICLQPQQVARIETVILVEMILQFISEPQLDALDEEIHRIAMVIVGDEVFLFGLRIVEAPRQTVARFPCA